MASPASSQASATQPIEPEASATQPIEPEASATQHNNLNISFERPPAYIPNNKKVLYSNQKKRIRDAGLPPIIGGDGNEYKILARDTTFLVKYNNEYLFIALGDDQFKINEGRIYMDGINNSKILHPFCDSELMNDYVKSHRYLMPNNSVSQPIRTLKRHISAASHPYTRVSLSPNKGVKGGSRKRSKRSRRTRKRSKRSRKTQKRSKN